MKRHIHIRWLAPAMLGLLLATPALSWAQDDLDVTMRMVADDQELDDSFVQQLELPESVDAPAGANGFGDMQTDSGDSLPIPGKTCWISRALSPNSHGSLVTRSASNCLARSSKTNQNWTCRASKTLDWTCQAPAIPIWTC